MAANLKGICGMKILVVGPSWVGDMCMAQVLFKMLKRAHPNATLDVLAPQWSEALLSRMPEVDTTLVLPFGHGDLQLSARIAFGKKLKSKGYDWALVLPNSWKSAVIPWAAGIPKRTGWLGEMRYRLLTDYRKLVKANYPLMIQRFAALVDFDAPIQSREMLPKPLLERNESNAKKVLAKLKLTLDKPVLILCPGAEYGLTKMWPGSHYAAVADQYLTLNWQVWVLGSPNDQDVADDLERSLSTSSPLFRNLVGQTKLGDAADLMTFATKVVANDSGLMHIASALELPTVAIYGSTSPEFTPPLGEETQVVQVAGLECSPCFERTCSEVHLRCLKDISPERVIQCLDITATNVGCEVSDKV